MENTMTLEERKFIIMARIAVLLGRQGYYCDVQQHPAGYTVLHKKIQDEDEPFTVSHHAIIFSNTKTEEELMQWWSELESDVK